MSRKLSTIKQEVKHMESMLSTPRASPPHDNNTWNEKLENRKAEKMRDTGTDAVVQVPPNIDPARADRPVLGKGLSSILSSSSHDTPHRFASTGVPYYPVYHDDDSPNSDEYVAHIDLAAKARTDRVFYRRDSLDSDEYLAKEPREGYRKMASHSQHTQHTLSWQREAQIRKSIRQVAYHLATI
jgi:hypothetical protein